MIPEVEWWDVLLRLAVAAGLTGVIGLERELRERAAGLRTHMLVGVGSALFTIVSAYGWGDFGFSTPQGVVFDPTRIAAQIVTGIGFLGAGAIIRQGLSVRGLTTAAGLWVVAAIGMAAGAGYYSAALIATGIVLVGLGPFRWLEGSPPLARLRRAGRVLEIDLTREHSISDVLELIDARRVRVSRVEFEDDEDGRHLRAELEVPLGPAEARLVDDLAALEGVVAVRWTE
ncbi:MAG TPA: MgtC/SapB family protein [Gaiellaceae bacterium]|nr:MgtC/SapB family protein [Gaiellaceae bacterium]